MKLSLALGNCELLEENALIGCKITYLLYANLDNNLAFSPYFVKGQMLSMNLPPYTNCESAPLSQAIYTIFPLQWQEAGNDDHGIWSPTSGFTTERNMRTLKSNWNWQLYIKYWMRIEDQHMYHTYHTMVAGAGRAPGWAGRRRWSKKASP